MERVFAIAMSTGGGGKPGGFLKNSSEGMFNPWPRGKTKRRLQKKTKKRTASHRRASKEQSLAVNGQAWLFAPWKSPPAVPSKSTPAERRKAVLRLRMR